MHSYAGPASPITHQNAIGENKEQSHRIDTDGCRYTSPANGNATAVTMRLAYCEERTHTTDHALLFEDCTQHNYRPST